METPIRWENSSTELSLSHRIIIHLAEGDDVREYLFNFDTMPLLVLLVLVLVSVCLALFLSPPMVIRA